MVLARNELWAEVEQHGSFCFALEGIASEYFTLLLETDREVRLDVILKTFEKRFGSSSPDLTHQMTSSRRCIAVGSPSASSPTGYSPWLPWSSISSLTCMPRPFPECYGVEDKEAGMYALMVSPRLWKRPLTGYSFSSIRDRSDRRNLCVMS